VKKMAARGSGLVIRFSSCAEHGTSGARVFRVTLCARWRKNQFLHAQERGADFVFLLGKGNEDKKKHRPIKRDQSYSAH
jgi:hypothetical protein